MDDETVANIKAKADRWPYPVIIPHADHWVVIYLDQDMKDRSVVPTAVMLNKIDWSRFHGKKRAYFLSHIFHRIFLSHSMIEKFRELITLAFGFGFIIKRIELIDIVILFGVWMFRYEIFDEGLKIRLIFDIKFED